MDRIWKYIYITIIINVLTVADSATLNDAKTLVRDLLSDYNVNVRPVADQGNAVNVTIKPYIKSIQEFDEVRGKFAFVGAFVIIWNDVNMMWNPALYDGISEVALLYENVWVPELILSSPSNNVDIMGQKWNRIRYFYEGTALWITADLFESTCSVNVKNYPFDVQECVTSFNTLGYSTNEVRLIPGIKEISVEFYQENSVWNIKGSRITTTEVGGGCQINLTFLLERKPSFVIINILLPIMFLSLLNVLVFLLVPTSGERISFCITVLLSIAVFLIIVSDMLPRSSDPVPIISYKLMIDMVLSSLIVLVTVINLTWYHTEDSVPVPVWLTWLYTRMCSGRKKIVPKSGEMKNDNENKDIKIQNISVDEHEADTMENKLSKLVENVEEIKPVTWRRVSEMFDRMFFIIFSMSSVLSFVIFLVVTTVSAK